MPKPELPHGRGRPATGRGAVVDEHEIVFGGERVSTQIYDRSKLEPGACFTGPAIVTEFDSTTVVLPGYQAEVDRWFNILITREREEGARMAVD